MPTRPLPARPNVAHLKHQAADVLNGHRARKPQVLQRLREFHPRMHHLSDEEIAAQDLKSSDAYLAIAREYGFPSWPKLKTFVERGNAADLNLPAHERISDAHFRRAVDLIDEGDAESLQRHLARYPELARNHVTLYGGNYFQTPTLLEFIAENPSRRGTLPQNIADVARVILEAGARENQKALDSALDLVASSSVARASGVQRALIAVLCDYGADPNAAMLSPLMYGEFDGVNALLDRGAAMNLYAASALNRVDDLRRLAANATERDKRIALALAAQHGQVEAVRVLLEAGADAAGFTPPPGHSHATPLHQAALYGHDEVANLLVQHGGRLDVRDIFYGATPADWAEHNGHSALARSLRVL
jgi:Ankyrin repeats (3 copies)